MRSAPQCPKHKVFSGSLSPVRYSQETYHGHRALDLILLMLSGLSLIVPLKVASPPWMTWVTLSLTSNSFHVIHLAVSFTGDVATLPTLVPMLHVSYHSLGPAGYEPSVLLSVSPGWELLEVRLYLDHFHNLISYCNA